MQSPQNEAFAFIQKNGTVTQFIGTPRLFDNLKQAQEETDELILAVPFSAALGEGRRGSTQERSARQHVSGIAVTSKTTWSTTDFLAEHPVTPSVMLADAHFDVTDEDYAARVSAVIEREIRAGHGSNFVLHRTLRGRIAERSYATELSLFRSLLLAETGAYWTFLAHFPDHSLVGASPEMHLEREENGLTTMNPISGTYRYPAGSPEVGTLRQFLYDPKERNELYMVVDEELKMMADICDERPWVSAPQVKFMSKLAHTEYFIHGHSSRPWYEAIQRTLVAPTVLGSPLDSAFRMAERNDVSPRNYLGGVLAHVPGDSHDSFDSAILIRTACIEADGEVSIPVGSTIVRDSTPEDEAAETRSKALGLLSAFQRDTDAAVTNLVNEALEERLADISDFWGPPSGESLQELVPHKLSAVILDNEDRFTSMLSTTAENWTLIDA